MESDIREHLFDYNTCFSSSTFMQGPKFSELKKMSKIESTYGEDGRPP